MGCFDYGCAVTGVSIKHGDPVLHVVVIGEYFTTLSGMVDQLWEYKRRKNDIDDFWVRHLPVEQRAVEAERLAAAFLQRHYMINFGTYNDYGWIEEVDRGDFHPVRIPNFMVKREAVDRIYQESGATEPITPIGALFAVANFMDICRINPFATINGHQHYEQKEHNAHLLRIELIKDALARKEQYWLDLEEELEGGD